MPEDDDENEYEREEQMIENIQKTYLVTDSLTTQLPANFVFSTNKKYIEVQNCKLYDIDNDEWPEDVSMHMNLIHERDYLDNNVGYVNQIKTKYRRYEVKGNEEELKLWFVQERSGPTTVGKTYIYEFPDKKISKFEDIDYRNQPESKDFEYLYDFLMMFFTNDMINAFWSSKLTLDVDVELENYKNSVIGTYYEEALSPLWEDKSFYINDWLLNTIGSIINWATDLERNDYFTIAVEKFVNFYRGGFMNFLYYNYDMYFDDSLYLPALGVCLAAPIFYGNYNIEDYFDELQTTTLKFKKTTLDYYFSFTMFNYYRIYNNTEYKYNISIKDGTIFTEYWNVVGPLMKKIALNDAHLMLKLADACNKCDIEDDMDVGDCLDIIGKDSSDYEILFTNGNSLHSRMYFFIELAHLYAGYKQEPLIFHEYSSSYHEPSNTTTALEIAIDPLYPDWWFYRYVFYNPTTHFKSEQIYLDGTEYKYRYRFFAEFMLIF